MIVHAAAVSFGFRSDQSSPLMPGRDGASASCLLRVRYSSDIPHASLLTLAMKMQQVGVLR